MLLMQIMKLISSVNFGSSSRDYFSLHLNASEFYCTYTFVSIITMCSFSNSFQNHIENGLSLD